MGAIILELQKDIIDPNIKLDNLLLKAYLIAEKLDLDYFKKWIDSELNGYPAGEDLPDYRHVSGVPMTYQKEQGLQPIIVDEKMLAVTLDTIFSRFPIKHSISNIVSRISTEKTNSDFGLSTEMASDLLDLFPYADKIIFRTGKNYLEEIVTKVKKALLDWTLKLEKLNVLGENLAFSEEEKEQASTITINYIINVIENFNNSSLQQATLDSEQVMTVKSENIDIP